MAAYAVAHGLAGVALPGFGVPESEAMVSSVSVETDHVVDDVAIGFESGWHVAVQAKRSLSLGPSFKGAVAQWKRAAQEGIRPKERLVIVTAAMPGWAYDLKRLLDRLKTDRPGSMTNKEEVALKNLDDELGGLSPKQRETLIKAASIHILIVEESDQQASREATRLLDHVVGRQMASQAWRDLVAHSGRTARQRGGFDLSGWLDLLLSNHGLKIATNEPTPAEQLWRKKSALDRYRSALRKRGSEIDLRPLGAALAPVSLDVADADVRVVLPGQDGRDGRKLLWVFLRRGRMILTGLPGGGKSLALAVTAARLVDVPDGPLPVAVSLRDVDRDHATLGFRDRLLDCAVKDLPVEDRPLVRAELEHRLETGGLALLLDSLDETHNRSGSVVAALDEFTSAISDDVDILLATRDVAYASAKTLGWPALQLASPREVERTVTAILNVFAKSSTPIQGEEWIQERERWVLTALSKDRSLRETPLLPVLLTLLAIEKGGDALPATRATILHAVVKAIVERAEARGGHQIHAGSLSGTSAARAILQGFSVEATTIASYGGRSSFEQLTAKVSSHIRQHWGLSQGQGDVTAEDIVRFWDENGVFVMSGAEKTAAPRVELFLEIGEALQVAQGAEQEISAWIDNAIQAGRIESVILAAGLALAASRQLLRASASGSDYDLLLAGMTAIRQGANPAQPEFEDFIQALLRDARRGDRESWRIWSTAVGMPLAASSVDMFMEVLSGFPAEYRVTGRALLLLRGLVPAAPAVRQSQMIEALGLRTLSELPSRQPASEGKSTIVVSRIFDEVIVGAAAELLCGHVYEAPALVAAALKRGSMGTNEQLCKLLRQHGHATLANEHEEEKWASVRDSLPGWVAKYDRSIHLRFLRDLASLPQKELSYPEAMRLHEIADFCETLNLDNLGAWPDSEGYHEWFWPLVTLVGCLGEFDMSTIAAQASLTVQRIEQAANNDAFYCLFDEAEARSLGAWRQIDDPAAAVELLVGTFFKGRGAALVAARSLWQAPVADIAIPLLEVAVPQLRPRPVLQRLAALTLLSMAGDGLINDWAVDGDPVLRAIAASHLPLFEGDALAPAIAMLTHDVDGHVIEAVLERLDPATVYRANAELDYVAKQPNPGWLCLHCGTENSPGHKRSCNNCRVVGPEPSSFAAALLSGKPKPARVTLNLDDWDA